LSPESGGGTTGGDGGFRKNPDFADGSFHFFIKEKRIRKTFEFLFKPLDVTFSSMIYSDDSMRFFLFLLPAHTKNIAFCFKICKRTGIQIINAAGRVMRAAAGF
jgi:hypothetical protein